MDAIPAPVPGRDWSGLLADLLIRIFSALELPDLLCSSAVCQSWNSHTWSVRRLGLCSKKHGPWLLYSSPDRDGDTATLQRLSTRRTYHISTVPPPSFRTRYTIGSSHGWIVAADEHSELHLFNPITRAQIDLPPMGTLKPVRSIFKKNKTEFVGYAIYNITPQSPTPDYYRRVPRYSPSEMRYKLYNRAILSSDPSEENCIVMLVHNPMCQLSFSRIGDSKWTWISPRESCMDFHDCIYNDNDGLFYVLGRTGNLSTFDLRGPEPVMNLILEPFEINMHCTKYLVNAPWGDLLQVWRYYGVDSDEEPKTNKVVVYKIDLTKQEIIKITDLHGHALFIGFNSSFFVSVKDFPSLSSNCVYLAHDTTKSDDFRQNATLKEIVVFNIEDDTFSDLSLPPDSWLNTPPPVWFMPSFTPR